MLIKLFSLVVTAKALPANIGWKSVISLQRGLDDPKFQVEGIAPANRSSQKTRLNDLSYGIKILTDLSSVLSQSTPSRVWRTDRQTAFSSLDRVCIPCSAVKTCTLTSRSHLESYKRLVSVSSRLVKPTSRSREVSVSVSSRSLAFTSRAYPCVLAPIHAWLTCVISLRERKALHSVYAIRNHHHHHHVYFTSPIYNSFIHSFIFFIHLFESGN